jgi:hypothetical protein
VRNVREAQRTFRELGYQLLAFGENEPAACNATAAIGFNPVAAGSCLIELSVAYSRPSVDRAATRNQVEKALRFTDAAGQRSGGEFFAVNVARGRSLQYVNHRT